MEIIDCEKSGDVIPDRKVEIMCQRTIWSHMRKLFGATDNQN